MASELWRNARANKLFQANEGCPCLQGAWKFAQEAWEGYIKLSTLLESLLKNLQQTFNHAYKFDANFQANFKTFFII